MSKLIVIGDIHGRNIWKQIVNQDFNKFIFIGDYFDSHYSGYLANRQIENFKDIIQFKRDNFNKVVLLVGNHDFHYMQGVGEHYSGYQSMYQFDIQEQLTLNRDCLQMCYINNNYLFTHAGVSKTWCNRNDIDVLTTMNLEQDINDKFNYQLFKSFRFTSGDNYSEYGDDITQSPIWIRPNSLNKDGICGYTQINGHTTQDKITIVDTKCGRQILIDTLGTSKEYLEINDNIVFIKEITN